MNNEYKGPAVTISPRQELSGYALDEILESVILHRRSTRRFNSTPVDRNDLDDILRAAIYAPSGSNAQNQRFLVITDPEEISAIGMQRHVWPYAVKDRQKLKQRYPSGILGLAPALVFVFIDAASTDPFNHGEYYIWEILEQQNAGAAIQNMLLMATAKGLASCWVSATENMSYTRMLSKRSWRDVFRKYQIPASYKIQGCVLLGSPKNTDPEGFATGEKKHGVIYGSTERKPLEHYLIPNKDETAREVIPETLSVVVGVALKILRRVMLGLAWAMKLVDKIIYKLEQ